ncbi:MAG TPA: cohesin domain-containing protein [Patescibacteria group bacterium]|nr:cohesin domain-containing protein [Patescibacteria group bacterium]
MFEKLGKYKVVLGALVVAILAGGVFFTVNQLQKQQEDRSHASGEQVAVILSPLTSTVAVGDKLVVQVNINTAQNNITAADITFNYDPAVLSVTPTSSSGSLGFTPASILNAVTNDSNTPGTIHFVGVNPTSASISGSMVNIGTISLVAKANGNSAIGFSNIQITAAGVSGILPIDTNNTKNGAYIVGTGGTTTPTGIASATVSPTGTTSATTTPNATPTPTILNAIQRIFDFNDDGKIDELDLNILYSGFAKRNGD